MLAGLHRTSCSVRNSIHFFRHLFVSGNTSLSCCRHGCLDDLERREPELHAGSAQAVRDHPRNDPGEVSTPPRAATSSCLGAASNLFGAIAGDWRASADLVAVVTGMLGGLASVPGCIFGGYLCDRFPRRTFYIFAALANAGGEVLMALAPHTPFWFAAM